ncbi:DUF4830 domain-containing protein [Evansella tamaricis]|uniref:DUF4830 domain-containing protein n=1 Tax=Evansella tamaricis TaxID=2069301 RepID=A0ABS6JDH1_9BACI|nr:DUF4830 domain-containing protein [Evansella tamaricis]MBU9711717.1 DUF4830 domain-containing protein [Evansella tamaricis]
MVKKVVVFTLFFIIILLAGCTATETFDEVKLSETALISKEFIEAQGYNVLNYKGNLYSYALSDQVSSAYESNLQKVHVRKTWQVQETELEEFRDSQIVEETFLIENHPLDNWKSEGGSYESTGKTYANVLISDGEVIGGTSSPALKETPAGNAQFSLDGKTFEDIHPNVEWREWADYWTEKYYDYLMFES